LAPRFHELLQISAYFASIAARHASCDDLDSEAIMNNYASLKLVFVGLVALAPLAAGCAVQASPSAEESSSEALSTSASAITDRPSTTAELRVHDPLCLEQKLESDVCLLDSAWRERAIEFCASHDMKVEGFHPSNVCDLPSPGGGTAEPVAAGAEIPAGSTGPSTTPILLASTSVIVDCCNEGVGPIVPPPASGSTAAAQ
jgi:hypothetical protein